MRAIFIGAEATAVHRNCHHFNLALLVESSVHRTQARNCGPLIVSSRGIFFLRFLALTALVVAALVGIISIATTSVRTGCSHCRRCVVDIRRRKAKEAGEEPLSWNNFTFYYADMKSTSGKITKVWVLPMPEKTSTSMEEDQEGKGLEQRKHQKQPAEVLLILRLGRLFGFLPFAVKEEDSGRTVLEFKWYCGLHYSKDNRGGLYFRLNTRISLQMVKFALVHFYTFLYVLFISRGFSLEIAEGGLGRAIVAAPWLITGLFVLFCQVRNAVSKHKGWSYSKCVAVFHSDEQGLSHETHTNGHGGGTGGYQEKVQGRASKDHQGCIAQKISYFRLNSFFFSCCGRCTCFTPRQP